MNKTGDKRYQLTNLETGQASELEAHAGTLGPAVLDIGAVGRDHGLFTYDPGFMATAATASRR